MRPIKLRKNKQRQVANIKEQPGTKMQVGQQPFPPISIYTDSSEANVGGLIPVIVDESW